MLLLLSCACACACACALCVQLGCDFLLPCHTATSANLARARVYARLSFSLCSSLLRGRRKIWNGLIEPCDGGYTFNNRSRVFATVTDVVRCVGVWCCVWCALCGTVAFFFGLAPLPSSPLLFLLSSPPPPPPFALFSFCAVCWVQIVYCMTDGRAKKMGLPGALATPEDVYDC